MGKGDETDGEQTGQGRANQKQESRKRKRREGRSTKTCKVMKKGRRQGETAYRGEGTGRERTDAVQ